MRYLPIFLDLRGASGVVVGGGEAAFHKCKVLLEAGARVTVVSPTLVPEFAPLLAHESCRHVSRNYQRGDLHGCRIAVVATDDPTVQEAVVTEANERGVLVNAVDRPDLCAFVMPAILSRGDIVIAVGTSATSPGFAAALRDRIGRWLGPEYVAALGIARVLRERWQSGKIPMEERRRRSRLLLEEDFLAALRRGDVAAVQKSISSIEGEEVELPSLQGLSS
ncbi:MAG: bifunctional precorrin-2 dehydrogenase/sirohydrochlorin ferrochelatase [Candidatus Binatia bacterium]|nr:bifunctional precorrin-2 dehydrogenase/sirohydrochlorin ferrochelatase [Candidatus Binatia bacterium]